MNDFINKIDSVVRDIYIYGRYGDEKVIDANARYYKLSKKSPAVARMVYRDTFKDCDKLYRGLVKSGQESLKEFTLRTVIGTRNAKIATNYEPAKAALQAFGETVEKLYPHSWWIRVFSVDTDRVVLRRERTITKMKKSFGKLVKKVFPKSEWADKIGVEKNQTSVKGKAGFFHKLKVGSFMKKKGIKSFFK